MSWWLLVAFAAGFVAGALSLVALAIFVWFREMGGVRR